MHDEIAALIARLLAQRWLPREDPLARKALLDETFREELDRRLRDSGLYLHEHPYAGHISLGVARAAEQAVFGGHDSWQSNSLQLDRDAIALLVVIWALIILPKRQRQLDRLQADADASQTQMFAEGKPISREPAMSPVLSERTLLADFGDRLGGKTRININLGQLARHGFIVRRKEGVAEGPLLDLAFDYERTARRILDGALGDLLGHRIPREDEDETDDERIDGQPADAADSEEERLNV
ncbi:hypothetical protein ACYJW8_01155 [Frateuria aurantia]